MSVIVTGAAGFIGMHVAERLLSRGERVVGVDVFNDYYDPALKAARAERLGGQANFAMVRLDIAEAARMGELIRETGARRVVHLAAQAGVRYSIEHPFAYERSNLAGHLSVLEACRHAEGFEHLVYASSSSVYGDRPGEGAGFKESDAADQPVSLYAATKRANELMAHSYAHLFGLPVTMLRYFTVYGPWGRPDMAIWKFTDALLRGAPLDVYAGGTLMRDFTFGEDAARATVALMHRPPTGAHAASPDAPTTWRADAPDRSWAPFEVYNVGRSDPVSVNTLLSLLESLTGRRAIRRALGMQPGDVERTFADTRKLQAALGQLPEVALADGLERFVRWFRDYHAL